MSFGLALHVATKKMLSKGKDSFLLQLEIRPWECKNVHRWGLNPLSGSVHFTIARKTKALASLHSEEFTTKHLLLKKTFLSVYLFIPLLNTQGPQSNVGLYLYSCLTPSGDAVPFWQGSDTCIKHFKEKKRETCRIYVIFYFVWVNTKLVESGEHSAIQFPL